MRGFQVIKEDLLRAADCPSLSGIRTTVAQIGFVFPSPKGGKFGCPSYGDELVLRVAGPTRGSGPSAQPKPMRHGLLRVRGAAKRIDDPTRMTQRRPRALPRPTSACTQRPRWRSSRRAAHIRSSSPSAIRPICGGSSLPLPQRTTRAGSVRNTGPGEGRRTRPECRRASSRT
jgi:hypothetical protein